MAKQIVSPVLRAFIEANADGEFPGDEIPLPPEMIARRKELAELATKQAELDASSPAAGQPENTSEAVKEPSRRIGPQNPDHPSVNRKPGGREHG